MERRAKKSGVRSLFILGLGSYLIPDFSYRLDGRCKDSNYQRQSRRLELTSQ